MRITHNVRFRGVKRTFAGGGSAGDSSDDDADKQEEKALHVGWLRGLDDAEAVRDRILDAVRRHRDSGLGGPVVEIAPNGEDSAILAARELLDEIRSWRRESSPR